MRCHIRLSLNFPREASARYVFQFFAEMVDFIETPYRGPWNSSGVE